MATETRTAGRSTCAERGQEPPRRDVRVAGGGSTTWEYGSGATDGTGALTISSLISSGGAVTPPPAGFDTFQVDASGRVGAANNTTFHGVMTPDKKAIFAVHTEGGAYLLTVFLLTGQTYVEADVAGTYEVHSLMTGATAASSSWGYGRFAATAAGATTFRYWAAPIGVVSLPNLGTLTLATDGTLTASSNATFHGQLSWNKDHYVRVQTAGGVNSLVFGVK